VAGNEGRGVTEEANEIKTSRYGETRRVGMLVKRINKTQNRKKKGV